MPQAREIMSSVSKEGSAEAVVPAKTPRELVLLRKQAKEEAEASQYTFKPKVAASKTTKGVESTAAPGSNVFTKLYEGKKKEVVAEEVPVAAAPKAKATAESINRLYGSAGAGKSRASMDATSTSPTRAASSAGDHTSTSTPAGNGNSNSKDKKTPPPKKALSAAEADAAASRLYAEAEKLRLKMEERKGELDKEFSSKNTFRPTLEKRKGKDGSGNGEAGTGGADVTERMKKYTEDKNRRLKEAEAARRSELDAQNTFKPSLVSNSAAKRSPVPAGSDGNGAAAEAAPEKAVFDRLTAARPKAAASPVAEHSFKPQLATKKAGAGAGAGGSSVPVHERLFEKGVEHASKMEAMRKQQQEEEIKRNCTFAPTIGSSNSGAGAGHARSSSSGSDGPVFDRLAATPTRSAAYDVVKDELELAECTFQPKVSELASSIRHDAPVHQRLLTEAEKLRIEAEKREAQRLQEEVKGATFAPNISEASKQLALKRQAAREAGEASPTGSAAASPNRAKGKMPVSAAEGIAMDALANSVIAAKPPTTPTPAPAAASSSAKKRTTPIPDAAAAAPPTSTNGKNSTNSASKMPPPSGSKISTSAAKAANGNSNSTNNSASKTNGRTSGTASPVVRTMAEINASLSPAPAAAAAAPEPAKSTSKPPSLVARVAAASEQHIPDSDDEVLSPTSGSAPIVTMEALLAGSGGLHILGSKMSISAAPAPVSGGAAPAAPVVMDASTLIAAEEAESSSAAAAIAAPTPAQSAAAEGVSEAPEAPLPVPPAAATTDADVPPPPAEE